MTEVERERLIALADRIDAAKAGLLSKGGQHHLSFRTYKDEGWVSSSSKLAVEALAELWGIAPALLRAQLTAAS